MKTVTRKLAWFFGVLRKLARVLFVIPQRHVYRWYLLRKLEKLSRLSGSPVPLTKGDHRGFAFLAGFLKGRQTTPKPLLSKEGRRLSSLKFWQWPFDKLGVKKELFMFWRWEKNDLRQLLKKLHTTPFKIAFTVSVFALILANIFFQQAPNTSLAASYTFSQSSWAGGADLVNTPVHPTNASNWTKYYSASSSMSAGTSLSLGYRLSNVAGVVTSTSDTDFSAGTFSNSGPWGSGNTASVVSCDYNHSGADWTPTNGDAYDLDSSANIAIAGVHCNIAGFSIPAGTTVYVYAYNGSNYGRARIYSASSTIVGVLSATNKGYRKITSNGEGPGPGRHGENCGGGYGGTGGGEGAGTVGSCAYNRANNYNNYGGVYGNTGCTERSTVALNPICMGSSGGAYSEMWASNAAAAGAGSGGVL